MFEYVNELVLFFTDINDIPTCPYIVRLWRGLNYYSKPVSHRVIESNLPSFMLSRDVYLPKVAKKTLFHGHKTGSVTALP